MIIKKNTRYSCCSFSLAASLSGTRHTDCSRWCHRAASCSTGVRNRIVSAQLRRHRAAFAFRFLVFRVVLIRQLERHLILFALLVLAALQPVFLYAQQRALWASPCFFSLSAFWTSALRGPVSHSPDPVRSARIRLTPTRWWWVRVPSCTRRAQNRWCRCQCDGLMSKIMYLCSYNYVYSAKNDKVQIKRCAR